MNNLLASLQRIFGLRRGAVKTHGAAPARRSPCGAPTATLRLRERLRRSPPGVAPTLPGTGAPPGGCIHYLYWALATPSTTIPLPLLLKEIETFFPASIASRAACSSWTFFTGVALIVRTTVSCAAGVLTAPFVVPPQALSAGWAVKATTPPVMSVARPIPARTFFRSVLSMVPPPGWWRYAMPDARPWPII